MASDGRCKRCVMDISAKEIRFTDEGCNFCTDALNALRETSRHASANKKILENIFESRKPYDCLIGLSGGVDSSYLLHLAVKLGYRPLAFTVDNGWNTPIADENILNLVEKLEVPLYRWVLNIEKFRELQAAFLSAGLKNIEIPTDHVLMAVSYEMASRYGIKYILSGGNVATESIMPPSWGYSARDLTHIKDVFRKSMGKELTGVPTCSLLKWNYYRWVKGIKTVYLLDFFPYNRAEAVKKLEEEYGYKSYGDKHCENEFTAWFQNFYLFEKFGIDKRKAHLSSLIMSGQITRDEALFELAKNPVYPELGLEKRALAYKPHEHEEYKMDKWYPRIAKFVKYVGLR